MIKSFADKQTAALFGGYVVKALPNQIQGRARASFLLSMRPSSSTTCAYRREIVSKRYMAIAADNSVFA